MPNIMNPNHIWELFKKLFPDKSKTVIQYRSHGRNEITLWFKNSKPFIFTIIDKDNWILKPYKL